MIIYNKVFTIRIRTTEKVGVVNIAQLVNDVTTSR